MKKSKIIKYFILIAVLPAVLIWGITSVIIASVTPPDKEKMEQHFQRDKETLTVVVDYLNDLDYPFVSISKSNIKTGEMFTGAYTEYQKIDDEAIVKAMKKLLNIGKYSVIGKSNNTVYFQKWSFIQKERGIAVALNKDSRPVVEFLIKSESLSEPGWYYYEADYEEYRKH